MLGVDDDVIFLKIHPAIVRVRRVNPTNGSCGKPLKHPVSADLTPMLSPTLPP
jgi:hypothetical protein